MLPLPLGDGRGEGFRTTVDEHHRISVGQSTVQREKSASRRTLCYAALRLVFSRL